MSSTDGGTFDKWYSRLKGLVTGGDLDQKGPKLESCVRQVKAQGHDEESAYAICNASVKAGLTEPERDSLIETSKAVAGEDGDLGETFVRVAETAGFNTKAIPANAVNIQDESQAPEGARVVQGQRGGLYYVPAGGEEEDGDGGGGDGDGERISDVDLSDIDFTDTVDLGGEDDSFPALGGEQTSALEQTLLDQYDEDAVRNTYDRIDNWKESRMGRGSYVHEKAFDEAFDLPGEVRENENDEREPTEEEIEVAEALAEASRQFIEANFEEAPSTYRGIGERAGNALFEEYFADPGAESFTFEASAAENYALRRGTASTFGRTSAVVERPLETDELLLATDSLIPSQYGTEGEVLLPGGEQEVSSENVKLLDKFSPGDDWNEDVDLRTHNNLGWVAERIMEERDPSPATLEGINEWAKQYQNVANRDGDADDIDRAVDLVMASEEALQEASKAETDGVIDLTDDVDWVAESREDREEQPDERADLKAVATKAEEFGLEVFRVIAAPDDDTDYNGNLLGIGVDFPESDVYVDWRREAFPEELDNAHVSIYGSVEDLKQATGNVIDPVDTYSSAVDVVQKGLFSKALPEGAVRISDPSQAPDDAAVRRGARGGLYYVSPGSQTAEENATSGQQAAPDADAVTGESFTSPDGKYELSPVNEIEDVEAGDRLYFTDDSGQFRDFPVEAAGLDAFGAPRLVIDTPGDVPTVIAPPDGVPEGVNLLGKIEGEALDVGEYEPTSDFGRQLANALVTGEMNETGTDGFMNVRRLQHNLSSIEDQELLQDALTHELENRNSKTARKAIAGRIRATGGDPSDILQAYVKKEPPEPPEPTGDYPVGEYASFEEHVADLPDPWGRDDFKHVSEGMQNREEWEMVTTQTPTEDLEEWLTGNENFSRGGREEGLTPGLLRRARSDDKGSMVLGVLAQREDSEIGIGDAMFISDDQSPGGASPADIEEKTAGTVAQLDDTVAAALLAHTTNIKSEEQSGNTLGSYAPWTKSISMGEKTEGYSTPDVVAHELGHSLHYMMGINYASGTDNQGTGGGDIDAGWRVNRDATGESKDLFEDLNDEWERMAQSPSSSFKGRKSALREYQTKNGHEFFAVGFEHWVSDRSKLEQYQPGLAKVFDSYFGTGENEQRARRRQAREAWVMSEMIDKNSVTFDFGKEVEIVGQNSSDGTITYHDPTTGEDFTKPYSYFTDKVDPEASGMDPFSVDEFAPDLGGGDRDFTSVSASAVSEGDFIRANADSDSGTQAGRVTEVLEEDGRRIAVIDTGEEGPEGEDFVYLDDVSSLEQAGGGGSDQGLRFTEVGGLVGEDFEVTSAEGETVEGTLMQTETRHDMGTGELMKMVAVRPFGAGENEWEWVQVNEEGASAVHTSGGI